MKKYPSLHTHQKSDAKPSPVTPVVTPDVIVLSGIQELDTLLGGFKAGELTYIDGNSSLISAIPHQLCVNTYRTFHSPTLYLDGGVCADPYQIAKYARAMEVDQDEILDHVHISRAFTVYQLSTFIEELLEKEIQKHDPRTLLIGNFPSLFLDPDVPAEESHTMLTNTLGTLRDITASYHLITVLTNREHRLYSSHIRETIQSSVHETIRMKDIDPCTYIYLLRRQKSTTLLHMAEGQLRLEHFGMVS